MPLLDPDENFEEMIDAIPGMRERLEAEAEELFPASPLDATEQDRLRNLSRRARRLRPVRSLQFGEVGSPGQQRNPFSIDTRGAARGVGNLAGGVINRIREGRRGEFEDEFDELAGRQEGAIEAEESRQEFVSENLPAMSRAVISQQGQDRRAAASDDSAEELENLRQQNRIALATHRNDLKNDPNNPETQRTYITGVRSFVEASNPGLQRIPEQVRELNRTKAGLNPAISSQKELIDEIDREVKELERDYTRQSARAAKMYRDAGVIPPGTGEREATDEEFNVVAEMRLKGVSDDAIQRYADAQGFAYFPERADSMEVDVDSATSAREVDEGVDDNDEAVDVSGFFD